MCVGSPITIKGSSGAMLTTGSTPFSQALCAKSAKEFSAKIRGLIGSDSKLTLPDSIREKFNTSLIMLRSKLLPFRITSTHSACLASNGVSAKRSAMPTMALSGVRISWLMLAKKALYCSNCFSLEAKADRNSSTLLCNRRFSLLMCSNVVRLNWVTGMCCLILLLIFSAEFRHRFLQRQNGPRRR